MIDAILLRVDQTPGMLKDLGSAKNTRVHGRFALRLLFPAQDESCIGAGGYLECKPLLNYPEFITSQKSNT